MEIGIAEIELDEGEAPSLEGLLAGVRDSMGAKRLDEAFASFVKTSAKLLPQLGTDEVPADLLKLAFAAGAVAQAAFMSGHAESSHDQCMSVMARFACEAMDARGLQVPDDEPTKPQGERHDA